MNIRERIDHEFNLRFRLAEALNQDDEFKGQIEKAAQLMRGAVRNGKEFFTFGNGGSALQAAHITVELEGRFLRDRRPVPALCLNTDFAKITALSNDLGYPAVFVRQLEARCKEGDVVIGLTTSDAAENDDHSRNILEAFKVAKSKSAKCIGLFSVKTQNLLNWVDVAIIVPSLDTRFIQEVHDQVIHTLCGRVEEVL